MSPTKKTQARRLTLWLGMPKCGKPKLCPTLLSAMATRRIAAPIATLTKNMGRGLSRPRWASSSSSPDTSSRPSSTKPTKKLSDRLYGVIDAVNDRKLPPELRGQRSAVRSETDIINVVEHRIWQSMEEGDFENLPGKGKPLDLSTNPHADPAEDTLYRVLSKNGCPPEWVELNKEIRNNIVEWRRALNKAWVHKCKADEAKWIEYSDALQKQLFAINDKVFRYNLIVPFGRQMFGLKWEKEVDKLKEEIPR